MRTVRARAVKRTGEEQFAPQERGGRVPRLPGGCRPEAITRLRCVERNFADAGLLAPSVKRWTQGPTNVGRAGARGEECSALFREYQ